MLVMRSNSFFHPCRLVNQIHEQLVEPAQRPRSLEQREAKFRRYELPPFRRAGPFRLAHQVGRVRIRPAIGGQIRSGGQRRDGMPVAFSFVPHPAPHQSKLTLPSELRRGEWATSTRSK